MTGIRIEPATEVPWADVEHSLTGGGDGATCWCQWYLIPRSEFSATPREGKRELLRSELKRTAPAPALLAYVDDAAAAWVRVGPRPRQPALLRARVLTAGSPEPLDDPGVWAVTCLVVRREHRGRGLAKQLVAAAVEHATANGARVIEAYPIDTDLRKTSNNEMFVGSVRLFQGQQFKVTSRPAGARVVMSRPI